jgi:hypothetical protein
LALGEDTTSSQLVSPGPLDTNNFLVSTNERRPTSIHDLVQTTVS